MSRIGVLHIGTAIALFSHFESTWTEFYSSLCLKPTKLGKPKGLDRYGCRLPASGQQCKERGGADADHRDIAGSGIDYKKQVAAGRKRQRIGSIAHMDRALIPTANQALAIVDRVDRDFLRAEVAFIEKRIVLADQSAYRVRAHQVGPAHVVGAGYYLGDRVGIE